MINTYKDFNYYVGKTLEYCQSIEHDIKWLYAMMLDGDPMENIKEITLWTLGKTVFELEMLDNSDQKASISKSDYKLLKHITGERNYITHQIYRDFLYESNYLTSNAYQHAKERLMTFFIKVEKLNYTIEKFRLKYAIEKQKIMFL